MPPAAVTATANPTPPTSMTTASASTWTAVPRSEEIMPRAYGAVRRFVRPTRTPTAPTRREPLGIRPRALRGGQRSGGRRRARVPRARRDRARGRARRRRPPAGAARRAGGCARPSSAPAACPPTPYPVIAALTSVGVCVAAGSPLLPRDQQGDAAGLGRAHHRAAGSAARRRARPRRRRGDARRSPRGCRRRSIASRCSMGVSGLERMTPTCTSVADRSRATSTTPTPQRVRPGSIPSTRSASVTRGRSLPHATARAPSTPGRRAMLLLVVLELGLHLGGEVEVAVDVLHVVAVFERVDEAEDLARGVGVDLDLEASGRTRRRPTRSRCRPPAARCAP